MKQIYLKRFFATLIALILAITSTEVLAQQQTIKGRVTDQTQLPVVGALVTVQNTNRTAMSDINGDFEIAADKGQKLEISFLGYIPYTLEVTNSGPYSIVLEDDVQSIEEVVVIGYGTLRKSDLTGAVESVKSADLVKRATTNAGEALQGRVAGVNVQKYGGKAGDGVSIKIRGVNTFGSNEPLYIIDGFPGSLESVNPSDIENIEVLKDGAASAIYGSVAANGVVIVTTRNGKAGRITFDISSQAVFTQTSNRLQMLNASEFVQMQTTIYENYNKYANNPVSLPAYLSMPITTDTDWQNEAFRPGFNLLNSFSMRGGSEVIKFALSANLADEKGVVIDNNFRQRNVRGKISAKKGIFQVDANVSYNATTSSQPNFLIQNIYNIAPIIPVYDSNEKYGFGLTNKNGLPNAPNIMAQEHYTDSYTNGQDFAGNISLAINFTSFLQFKSSYAYRGTNSQGFYKQLPHIADVRTPVEYAYYSENRSFYSEETIDNVLSFDEKYGKHSINAMIGSSINLQSSNWNSAWVEGKTTVGGVQQPAGFADLNFSTLDAGKGGTYGASGSNYQYNRVSFFGRLNYNYDDRYLVQATVRTDGSSKFGINSRWGVFPSVAVGWRIDRESFLKDVTAINILKIRGSWGQLGNEVRLGYYDSQSLISTGNTLWYGYVQGNGSYPWPGSISPSLENRDLRWETTESINVGIDYGFLNKFSGSINYYSTQTNGLLITKKLAPSAGLNDPILNVGKIRNSGFEFTFNYNQRFANGIGLNAGVNMSTLKNEVIELSDANQILYGTGLKYGTEHFPTQTRMGMPIGGFYLYQTAGIFQSDQEAASYVNSNGQKYQINAKAGDLKFVDTNGDGVIDESDKVYMGSGMPKFEFNLNFGLDYKGIDFSFLLGGGFGHKIYNGNRYVWEAMNSGVNMLSSTLNAWTPTNTNTNVPRAVLQDPNGNSRESDRFLEKGDYLRLRNIQLGYTLPEKWMSKIYIQKLRIFVSADNLFTITEYSGIDPEFARSSPLNAGVDNLIYPMTSSVVCGIQVTF